MSSSTFRITQTPTSINIILYPNGAIRSGCTAVGAADNYLAVDDYITSPDDDLTYVYRDGVSQVTDLYSIDDPSVTSGTINNVTVYGRVKSHLYPQSNKGRYRLIVSLSNVSAKSGDIDISTSYNTYKYVFESTPSSSAWNWYDISHCSIGFDCSSPSGTIYGSLTLRPDSNGMVNEWEVDAPFGSSHWDAVNEIVANNDYDYVYAWYGYPDAANYHEYFNIEDTTATGTITSLSVFYKYTNYLYGGYSGEYIRSCIYPSAATSYGLSHTPEESWLYASDTWSTNPETGIAWTFADINSLQIGLNGRYCACTQMYAVVDYSLASSPQIRTTQIYAMVNYVPSSSTCFLTKPYEYTLTISNDVKKLNFWSGNRAVYNEGISAYSLSMSGNEYNTVDGTALSRLNCVKNMKDSGSPVTLSNFFDSNMNDTWYIKDFSYEKSCENVNIYSWKMVLEKESHNYGD